MQKFDMSISHELSGYLVVVSMGTVMGGYLSADLRERGSFYEPVHPQISIFAASSITLAREAGVFSTLDKNDRGGVFVSTSACMYVKALILPEYFGRQCELWFKKDVGDGRMRRPQANSFLPLRSSSWVCHKSSEVRLHLLHNSRQRTFPSQKTQPWLIIKEVIGFQEGEYSRSTACWFEERNFVAFHGSFEEDSLTDLLYTAFRSLPKNFEGKRLLRATKNMSEDGRWAVYMDIKRGDIEKAIIFLSSHFANAPSIKSPRDLI